ncbi:MAG: TrpR-related protein YerC/YecD [Clostridiales bacterium]|jgi:TrpR-related protein YerC/YecD|nr:TrpR-related protein YerC/YecD [Clostridiales bacterium]HOB64404.1 YerC/YecD family TrpR-related protein [Clostridia bacterium]HOK81600.1 YerC/YecD family TrpR-related protein [Clostridia bacterium]HOL60497.1 YerC/YecD family TrpR-related protein [Clostridia bacterium]HPO52904.1 YerC/YecD family TrpR-related protein [Clostridia bacterium]
MKEKITGDMINLLYDTLIKVQTREDCEILLSDLCTVNEVLQMAQRVKAAELLLKGNTYAQVIAQTDISSATLSRVSNSIRHGKGGYRKFIEVKKEEN